MRKWLSTLKQEEGAWPIAPNLEVRQQSVNCAEGILAKANMNRAAFVELISHGSLDGKANAGRGRSRVKCYVPHPQMD